MTDRYDYSRRRGIRDQAVALPLDARKNDELAAAAERFVARCYGLPTLELTRRGPDRGYDFELLARRRIRTTRVDVKWTPRDDGALIVRMTKKGLRAHAYVLVTGATPADFRIRGFAWRHTVAASTGDVGHGPSYVVDQAHLRPADLLFACSGYAVQETEKPADVVDADRPSVVAT